ncbi:hypothetical protein J6590_028549 [Homalodisca vitripennis]|nr:hypothetical protein J6590_028549 [Homalodisca vitripennis]
MPTILNISPLNASTSQPPSALITLGQDITMTYLNPIAGMKRIFVTKGPSDLATTNIRRQSRHVQLLKL